MEAKNSNNTQKHHAIFLPLPLQGHINPAIDFSLKLASSRNFTITFLTFEFLHQQIIQARPIDDSDDIFSRARQGPNGLDIRYRTISDGLPLEFDRTGKVEEVLGWYVHGSMLDQVEKGVEEIVLKSKPKVDALIIDTFYPWASKIAKKFGLRLASFWTEPALVFNLYYHVHLLKKHGHFDCPADASIESLRLMMVVIAPKTLNAITIPKPIAGTSTLLNHLFQTNFREMDAFRGS